MKLYEMLELAFPCEKAGTAWADVRPKATFCHNGEVVETEGFYAADGQIKVRFLPMCVGHYEWQVDEPVGKTGSFEVEAATSHGPVHCEGNHFRHADGTPFLPVGTTVYALVHQDDALVNETLETLAHAPFNKVRICVFPKHYDFVSNEPPCYPFERDADGKWDARCPSLAFWDRFERILARLFALDIQVDLILFHPYDRWGFDTLTQEENLIYLDYLMRRLAAYPSIWWSLANEYDLCPAKTMTDWHDIEEFVCRHDPYHHLLSCHNFARFYGEDRPGCTHASIQTKQLALIPEYAKRFGGRPVIIDECGYEGNLDMPWGCLSAREMTNRFWRAYTCGAYCTHGETYKRENSDIVWWARGGKLIGESIPRIRFLKAVFEEILVRYGALESDLDWMSQMMSLSLEEGTDEAALLSRIPHAGARMLVQGIFANDWADRVMFAIGERQYRGRCGDKVFLTFYDHRCSAFDTLSLPKHQTYTVELIDTWNMTRDVLLIGARGKTDIRLPGKEGMAVLCTAEGA